MTMSTILLCRPSNNFVLLQCTSAYPTEPKDVHLSVLDEYRHHFPDIHIGYSGHEMGCIPTLGAVAKGAKVIGKASHQLFYGLTAHLASRIAEH